MQIILNNVGKRFNREWIFRRCNYEFQSGKTYAITGPNGSGKSTLLQVISGSLIHNEGNIKITNDQLVVTAEQLYVNQKVSDLISNAEMEQSDYRRGGKPNVFFGAQKRYLGMKINVFVFNTIVLVGSAVGLLGLLHWILRRQLEVPRSVK